MAIRLTLIQLRDGWAEQAAELVPPLMDQVIDFGPGPKYRLSFLPEADPADPGPWVLDLSVPPSLNRLLSVHHMKRHKSKKAYMHAVQAACIEQKAVRLGWPVRVDLELRKPGRPMDEDNVRKPLHDALVAAGVLVDDGPGWCRWGTYQAVKAKPAKLIVTIHKELH
jgi:hypothetical protein